ncbi:Mth938-like domain-containing protein [Hydrogenovibrio kuenenii]|uniref:Mth938-like domain-containing protein n=1 Tax=Hydrogenovibrio kuenenii TaxID=63658 RepID=UPI000464EC79|nr:Mth938-like domain-containing protein [Hydrogenovibrio kuenenii]
MKFTEHRDSNILTVKNYQAGSVKVNDKLISHSCYLNQKNLVSDWQCNNLAELNEDRLDELFLMQPEIIILGTGENQQFPHPKYFAYCAQRGIGLEVMDNAAACRTYNVLTTEEREVVLALII